LFNKGKFWANRNEKGQVITPGKNLYNIEGMRSACDSKIFIVKELQNLIRMIKPDGLVSVNQV